MSTHELLTQMGFKQENGGIYSLYTYTNPLANDRGERDRYTTSRFRLVRRWLFWFQITDFKTYNHQTHLEKTYGDCRFSKDNLAKLLSDEVLPIKEEFYVPRFKYFE